MTGGPHHRLSRLCATALLAVAACRAPEARHAAALRDELGEALRSGHFEDAARLTEELEEAGDEASATLARITLAERLHDPALLPRSLPAGLPDDVLADARGAIALATYSIHGLAAASKQLTAACESKARAALRSRSCVLAAQARLALGRPLLSVRGATRASVEVLPEMAVPIIQASINGMAEERFVIDTGAVSSILSRSFCERANIDFDTEAPRQMEGGARHTPSSYPAIVERIEIGDIALYNVPVFVMDVPAELAIAGVIAPLDTFRDQSVELDMKGRRLRLLTGAQAELKDWTASWGVPVSSTPLIWVGTQVFVDAQVDGLPGWFLFDTGAQHNLVGLETARRLGHEPNPTERLEPPVGIGRAATFGEFDALLGVGPSPPERTRFSVQHAWPQQHEQLFPLARTGTVGSAWLAGRRLWLPPGGRSVVFSASSHGG